MFVLAVTAGGVRRKNVVGAQARQARVIYTDLITYR
jgi:hypothetical protein